VVVAEEAEEPTVVGAEEAEEPTVVEVEAAEPTVVEVEAAEPTVVVVEADVTIVGHASITAIIPAITATALLTGAVNIGATVVSLTGVMGIPIIMAA
jgi:hypothetical protein